MFHYIVKGQSQQVSVCLSLCLVAHQNSVEPIYSCACACAPVYSERDAIAEMRIASRIIPNFFRNGYDAIGPIVYVELKRHSETNRRKVVVKPADREFRCSSRIYKAQCSYISRDDFIGWIHSLGVSGSE